MLSLILLLAGLGCGAMILVVLSESRPWTEDRDKRIVVALAVIGLVLVIFSLCLCINEKRSEMADAKVREAFWANCQSRTVSEYSVLEWGCYNEERGVYYVLVDEDIPRGGSMLLIDERTLEVNSADKDSIAKLEVLEDYAVINGKEETVTSLYDKSDDSLVTQSYQPEYGFVHYVLYVPEDDHS